MIVRLDESWIGLLLTVTDVSTSFALVIFRVKLSCITSVDGIKLWLLTLTRRAQLVCDSPDSLQDETDYLNNVFSKNNYNVDFVRRNAHSKADSNTLTNVNSGPVSTATLPYISGTAEAIARILQPYNIRVAHKRIITY